MSRSTGENAAGDWGHVVKEWLVDLFEHTPLEEVDRLPLGWIASDAVPLVSELMSIAEARDRIGRPSLSLRGFQRAAGFGRGRPAEAAWRIPGELASLHAVLIRELAEREDDPRALARAAGDLAVLFGIVGEAALGAHLRRARRAETDELPGRTELEGWLSALLAEGDRHGPLAVAHVAVDGADRIERAFGARAAARIVAAVAEIVISQLSGRQRAFRAGPADLVVVAPGTGRADLELLGSRLAGLVASAQLDIGPRVALATGVAEYPRDGDDPTKLLRAAEHASWAARAAGVPIEYADRPPVHDP
ncbi:MAG TPA: diguanylate cyclase [Solirubrobacterales bacterium]